MQHNKSNKKNKSKSPIFISLLIVILIELLLIFSQRESSKPTLLSYANQILQKCSQVRYRPGCYEEEIPKLVSKISMKDTFAVTGLVQEQDPTLLHCHTLGHKIAGAQVNKDPSKWEDVITSCPVNQCNQGCLHGAIMTRFENEYLTDSQIEKIKPELYQICQARKDWNPTDSDRAICYHSLGHMFMFITKANIDKSLTLCKFVSVLGSDSHYLPSCSQAVFMSIYQPLDPEGEALVKGIAPTKETMPAFCAKYSGVNWESCRNESWILYSQDIMQSPKNLTSFCSYSEGSMAQTRCYETGLNKISIDLLLTALKIDDYKNYCLGLEGSWQEKCFSEGTKNLLQADKRHVEDSVTLCSAAAKLNLSGQCSVVLSDYYPKEFFHNGSKEFTDYCNSLPNILQKKCLGKTS